MNSEVVRGKPLTKEETKLLLDLIESSPIILSKMTNAASNKLKIEKLVYLTRKFNASTTVCRRTSRQLRLMWEHLKKLARKRSKKFYSSSSVRNLAIAEYYTAKKQYLYAKKEYILLHIEKLKLEFEKLKSSRQEIVPNF